MDQILAALRCGTPAEALLRLVVDQLGTSMGMLTLHGPAGYSPRILTSLNMPDDDASTIAASIDRDLAGAGEVSGIEWHGAMGWPVTAAREPDGHTRMTFLYRDAYRGAIGLTGCRTQGAESSWDGEIPPELARWIEPALGLLWRAECEFALQDGLAAVIDRLDFGIVLLDPDISPWFINARAKELLEAGDGIRRVGRAIAAADFDDTIRLQSAIRHNSVCADSFHVLLLHRARTRPLIAVVASLSSRHDFWNKPATALCLLDPDRDRGPVVSALCRAYGLTATESMLVVLLMGGATIENAASRMHIQTQTARAYLKQVFAKTGTHRQADLVRAILGSIVQIG